MDKIRTKNQNFIFNLIYTYFVFSLTYLFGLGMGLKLNIVLQIFIVILGSIIVKFFLFNPLILYGILGTSFLIVISVHRFVTPILFAWTERSFYLIENIIYNFQGKENIASDNLISFWIILIILVSVFTSFILFKGKSIYLLPPVYITFFLYYWYNYLDEAYFMISTFLLLFFILMSLDKYSKENPDIKNNLDYASIKLFNERIKTVTIYGVLIILLAVILPKKNYFIEWPWLNDRVYTIFPFVEELRYQHDYNRKSGEASLFNFSMTGYQNNSSKLGGPVELSNKKIMTVFSDNNIYLRGNVRHTYTGESWETIDMPTEFYGLKQDFSKLTKEESETYFTQTNITIINHSFASTTIFSPYKAYIINTNNKGYITLDSDNILVFSNGVYDAESYVVGVQQPLTYGVLIANGINNKKEDLSNLPYYLQTPNNKITNRTKALVKEIVEDSNNDFQKAVAIEDFLRNNYEYRLDVLDIPDGKEFIDYFLFEEQKGYCTYYATAMAVMLRLEGIPSRYIEGYLANEEIEPGIYEISHKDAHAWVEAFIEPVGWMTFEPTAAYDIQDRLEDYQLPDLEEDQSLDDDLVDSKSPRINNNQQSIDLDQDIIDAKNSSNYNQNYNDIQTKLPKYIGYILISLLLLIIPVRFIIGFILYIYHQNKTKKLPANKKIIYLYSNIVQLQDLLGYPQQYGETHHEYANRIAYKFYSHNEKGIKEVTEIFVKSKYSNAIASDEDVNDLEKYMSSLDKRLRSRLGPVVYYYRKYVKRDYFI